MKHLKHWTLALALALALLIPRASRAQAQEAVQLALNFEKLLQLKSILNDMYEGYRILSTGYNAVKGIAEGNYKLHEAFLDGLWLASPGVRKYYRIADIIRYQQHILQEYQSTYRSIAAGGEFSADELLYLSGVYQRLFKQSLQNLDELAMIISSGKLRMSDYERIEAIDRVYDNMKEVLGIVRDINTRVETLEKQRRQWEQQAQRFKEMVSP
ncbi:TerB family tellurite resistance protein [Echinicola marina]|uniref:TerB family tellurite resistance protein n=1 Tax=Echinicola marina TaxID=2859768 RepID=UPI001CF652E3|nr:TerB family tellurite resistance protein [Echinicola marina]UCS94347.1 TerB family tellurite resistance protein [Echinicola marina]